MNLKINTRKIKGSCSGDEGEITRKVWQNNQNLGLSKEKGPCGYI